jgi:hypothetical protein
VSAPVDTDALRAIWQDLMTAHGAIDAAVPEDENEVRVYVDAALGTLTRAKVALEDLTEPRSADATEVTS